MSKQSSLQFMFGANCIKYILLYEQGGLGNQLFQYYAARLVAPSASVICIGYRDLQLCVEAKNEATCPRLGFRILRKLFAVLGVENSCYLAHNLHFFGSIIETSAHTSTLAQITPGILPGIYIQTGFFQDPPYFSTLSFDQCPIRSDLVIYARQWLHTHIQPLGGNPYFLHVRRGDYTWWPSKHYPAVLPLKWYLAQMDSFKQHDPCAHFIVLSDDIPFVEELLANLPSVTVHKGSLCEDFAIMTQCQGGGILSASTFAWWAAWYGRQCSPKANYIAPKYWAGWRSKDWYPANIKTPWLEYVDVC